MKLHLLGWLAISTLSFAQAQSYQFNVDLNKTTNDQVNVELIDIPFHGEEMAYHFPKTIPGTYSTEDYGKYIENFKAYDNQGNELKVKIEDKNSYVIKKANELAKITYSVNDSWDSGVKKDKIFEPAGTNFEAGKNFVLNNAGLFGYFTNQIDIPYEITFNKPEHLFGMSVLENDDQKNKQVFKATDYHQVVDCPILFAAPDTANFKVANTDVTIAVYAENGKKYAKKVYDELNVSMQSISEFVGTLPVNNYTFIIYLKDQSELGQELATDGITISTIKKLKNLGGVGALEHGNSSLYYLVDFGDAELPGPLKSINYMSTIKDVAIHEFMHIFTPLSLHSEHIGNFDYINPTFSKHLWLYEGITEYFAGLIQLRAGDISVEEYFEEVMQGKIAASNKFPEHKMSFTEMSENVIEKKYQKQYLQVYQRGALMGMLLDIEIMKLTNNEKTLRDVIVELVGKYGADKSFSEETFFDEMTQLVHPDLRKWFTLYVEGKNPLPIAQQLEYIGWKYEAKHQYQRPILPQEAEGVKTKSGINGRLFGKATVKKIKKNTVTDLQVGDELNTNLIRKAFQDKNGEWLPEGTTVTYGVSRNGASVTIETKVTVQDATIINHLSENPEPTAKMKKNLAVWANLK